MASNIPNGGEHPDHPKHHNQQQHQRMSSYYVSWFLFLPAAHPLFYHLYSFLYIHSLLL